MLKCLNDLKEEDYLQVRELASLFFTPLEISEMLEIEEAPFLLACKTKDTKEYNAYKGGRFDGEIQVRTGIIKMAKAGSTPAQTMAIDLIKKSQLKSYE